MPKRSVAGGPSEPVVKYTELALDGKTYHLAFDFNAIAEAEKLTGANLLLGIAGIIASGVSAAQLRGLLYASLRHAHPKMTLLDAGALITIETVPEIIDAIKLAYNISVIPEKTSDPSEGGSNPAAPPESS